MMNASNPPGESPDAPGPVPVRAGSESSAMSRLIAGLAGVFLLLIVASDMHLALAGIVGAIVAWLVQRVRRRPYTRTSGWIGSVALTGVAFVVTFGFLTASAPAGTLDRIMQTAEQDQARRPRPKPPAFLRQLAPGVQPSPAADSLTQHMIRSRLFTIAILVITAITGGGIASVALGTLGWATTTALLFAIFGRWTFGAPPTAPPA
jgi:hypothetical protein